MTRNDPPSADRGVSVGFVGLGVMGGPMAGHVLDAGFDLVVWARRRESAADLVSRGARYAATLEELASSCGTVVTVLPAADDVTEVLTRVLPLLAAGSLLIDASTIDPGRWRALAERAATAGIDAVDAPVTGGDVGARAGTLTVMCGGADRAVERARPILEAFASEIVHVGATGAGQVVKAANQVQAAASLLGMAEALVLAAKAGVDPAHVVNVLSRGAARCWAIEHRGPRAIRRDFEPGFRVALHRKDLSIALELARELEVSLPIAAQAREAYSSLMANGQGADDVSAVLTLYERASGVRAETAGEEPT
ncbi:MAG TPA: NAD(P)-dependent oxidoreductase [Gaiellaceae bacterium]|jgi:3-hydroxyisobutyrate dehydrogenase